MNKQLLLSDTILLLEYNQQLESIFQKIKETGEVADFFTVVKPFADQVRDVLESWEKNVLKWIALEKPKYFYKQQVDNLIENITTVSIQAFFPDTKGKKFKELIRSNQYTLEMIKGKLSP